MPRRLVGVVLAVAAYASPALAQVTRCGPELGKWVCRTEQQPQYGDIMQRGLDAQRQGWEQQQRVQDTINARRAAEAQAERDRVEEHNRLAAQQNANRFDAQRHDLEVKELIERYIAIGRCKEATQLAYDELGSNEGFDTEKRCEAR